MIILELLVQRNLRLSDWLQKTFVVKIRVFLQGTIIWVMGLFRIVLVLQLLVTVGTGFARHVLMLDSAIEHVDTANLLSFLGQNPDQLEGRTLEHRMEQLIILFIQLGMLLMNRLSKRVLCREFRSQWTVH